MRGKKRSHIECDRREKGMKERFYNVMVESFGTVERRKPREAQNPFESYLDCKRSTGFTPRAHALREASLLIVWLNQSLFETQPSFD